MVGLGDVLEAQLSGQEGCCGCGVGCCFIRGSIT